MRSVAAVVAAAVLATGCMSNTYKITGGELQRLAMQPPDTRGERVRVHQQLSEVDVGARQPVTSETQVMIFPEINIGGYDRRRYYHTNSSWGTGGGGRLPSGNLNLGGMHMGGGGGGGDKGAAIAIIVIAAIAMVAVVAVEGSRWDGDVRLHPMHPVYLVGKGGERVVMPLAWIDPETAAYTDKAYVRRDDGPWNELGRAPLDRQGWNFSMYGGTGIVAGIDGARGAGKTAEIQLGYFPVHEFGLLGTLGFAWRDNEVGTTNFHARYSIEGQLLPVSAGPFYAGGYLGWGGAYRSDEQYMSGYVVDHEDDTSRLLRGGALLQLELTTRIALTGRVGVVNSFGENTTEALFGLSVY